MLGVRDENPDGRSKNRVNVGAKTKQKHPVYYRTIVDGVVIKKMRDLFHRLDQVFIHHFIVAVALGLCFGD